MDGIDVVDHFYDTGLVQYKLTAAETIEYFTALRKTLNNSVSLRSLFRKKTVASNMSPDLENLVCGNCPQRYTVILPKSKQSI